ncbi:Vacuolar transporter chaperone [Drechslerella dactyloides]|uniref:Vacuolar transporter chaperone n=1 Tax=Drechslerella dactyloides TaxID=74499 RepID=A0AAD6NJA0_DREDA|nr:Vacuolar transporter chaperone [Drechslerella dactyloides]
MKFGETLKKSLKEEWKDNYIDYSKLKKLLREKESEPTQWTEQDESSFVEELVNVQIEKVNTFHGKLAGELKERVNACEAKLEHLLQPAEGPEGGSGAAPSAATAVDEETKQLLASVTQELDNISKEISDLYKFSRLNFTACLKAAKKHDRLKQYKIRPLVQVRLSSLPFSSEDYSPLLYRISALYAFVGQYDQTEAAESGQSAHSATYESHKFWVHPDNFLEVKTYILRRLPVLIYNPQDSKIAQANRKDPTLTSLYFDNSQFDLYTHKLDKYESAASLRLRWYGQLAERPEIVLERKVVPSAEGAEESAAGTEERVTLKDKEIYRFVSGTDDEILERKIAKTRERKSEEEARKYEKTARGIHNFIKENSLQPILRAVYTRTAFQIPGDNQIRISMDTDLTFIKEDALDPSRPSRPVEDWHRRDIDDRRLEYPFNALPKDEISKFPYALLEIKIQASSLDDRSREWIVDLMNSHLVYDAPRFSKFVHGVSVLFEDNVNSFPFWFGDLDKDIRKDPNTAYQQEQEKLKAEGELTVGSFVMGRSPLRGSPFRSHEGLRSRSMEPAKSRHLSAGAAKRPTSQSPRRRPTRQPSAIAEEAGSSSQSTEQVADTTTAKDFAKSRRRSSVKLPPGVTKPSSYIKDAGPLQVEAKVWLANQRTFIKWQHICVLLATLSLALYNAAGEKNDIARAIGFFFTGISVFTGVWGYWTYIRRSESIHNRSEKGFDSSLSLVGPVVVCITVVLALMLNFLFKFKIAFTETSWYLVDLTEDAAANLPPSNVASPPFLVQGQGHPLVG